MLMIDKELNIFTLPLISQYRILTFTGVADGSLMTPGFLVDPDIQKKILVLKSFRMIPYSPVGGGGVVDFYLNDGVTVNREKIFEGGRLNRFNDLFGGGYTINLKINSTSVSLFTNNQGAGFYPGDLWVDNIFYKFPEKLDTIELSIKGLVVADISVSPYIAPNLLNPNMKVVIECYLTI